MLILHLAYEQNCVYLWGEVSFDRLRRPRPGEDGYAALPWGAKPPELRAALKETGVAVILCVLSLNLLGDGLRDFLDPKVKGGRRK